MFIQKKIDVLVKECCNRPTLARNMADKTRNQFGLKEDEIINDILLAEDATKEELEVSKKSKTYKDELICVNEQKRYKKELSDLKKRHLLDLLNMSNEVKNNQN